MIVRLFRVNHRVHFITLLAAVKAVPSLLSPALLPAAPLGARAGAGAAVITFSAGTNQALKCTQLCRRCGY